MPKLTDTGKFTLKSNPETYSRSSGVVVSELQRFNQNSERAVVVTRAKVTLTKIFGIKTRYIRNNNGLPILTLQL